MQMISNQFGTAVDNWICEKSSSLQFRKQCLSLRQILSRYLVVYQIDYEFWISAGLIDSENNLTVGWSRYWHVSLLMLCCSIPVLIVSDWISSQLIASSLHSPLDPGGGKKPWRPRCLKLPQSCDTADSRYLNHSNLPIELSRTLSSSLKYSSSMLNPCLAYKNIWDCRKCQVWVAL